MMLSSLVTSLLSLTRPLRMLINTNKLKHDHLKHDLLVYVESLHGGEEDGEGGELGNVEHHDVLLRLLAGALGVRAQARSLYHNLREVRIRQ